MVGDSDGGMAQVFMDLNGKKVLVVGMARTGIATAKFLKAKGSLVTTTEMKPGRGDEGGGSGVEGDGHFHRMGRASSRDLSQTGYDCGEPGRGPEHRAHPGGPSRKKFG